MPQLLNPLMQQRTDPGMLSRLAQQADAGRRADAARTAAAIREGLGSVAQSRIQAAMLKAKLREQAKARQARQMEQIAKQVMGGVSDQMRMRHDAAQGELDRAARQKIADTYAAAQGGKQGGDGPLTEGDLIKYEPLLAQLGQWDVIATPGAVDGNGLAYTDEQQQGAKQAIEQAARNMYGGASPGLQEILRSRYGWIDFDGGGDGAGAAAPIKEEKPSLIERMLFGAENEPAGEPNAAAAAALDESASNRAAWNSTWGDKAAPSPAELEKLRSELRRKKRRPAPAEDPEMAEILRQYGYSSEWKP